MWMLIIFLCSPGMEIKPRHLFSKIQEYIEKSFTSGLQITKRDCAQPGKTLQTGNAFTGTMKTWNEKTAKGEAVGGGIYKNTSICDSTFPRLFQLWYIVLNLLEKNKELCYPEGHRVKSYLGQLQCRLGGRTGFFHRPTTYQHNDCHNWWEVTI